jgi:hypothetical protein
MTTTRGERTVTAVVVVVVTAVFVAVVYYFNRPTATSMPHIPTPAEVAEMSAEMNGTLFGLPVTESFKVPKEFHAEVCRYFAEQPSKWSIYSEEAVQKSKLGQLHFELVGGGRLDSSFYTAGKGAIGFSIGRDYYIADTGNHDGGLSLLFVLDRARRAAGIPLPPPYPPPIGSDDNIAGLTVSVRHSPDKPEITNYAIPAASVSTVMRWLRGRVQTIPEMWPESQRLGVLNVALKSGEVVAISYYRASPGEVRFSINNTSYRVLNPNSSDDDTISGEIRDIIRDEKLKK